MNSMTGYGYKEINTNDIFASVEIKSWNSRFLDLSFFMPSYLSKLEKNIREKCASRIFRGKVDITIKLKEMDSNLTVSTNVNIAKNYFEAIKKIASSIGYSKRKIPLSLIIEQEGVLVSQKETDIEKYWNILENLLCDALDDFCKDREREGNNLKIDLLEKLAKIEQSEAIFKKMIRQMEDTFKSNIEKRFSELLGENYDQQRVMTEIASLLIKYTINEEVVRLQSHIDSLKNELENNPTPGRKLDFICQEMNREINTIGSKNQFIEVGQAVIEAKDALENIREQARNVE